MQWLGKQDIDLHCYSWAGGYFVVFLLLVYVVHLHRNILLLVLLPTQLPLTCLQNEEVLHFSYVAFSILNQHRCLLFVAPVGLHMLVALPSCMSDGESKVKRFRCVEHDIQVLGIPFQPYQAKHKTTPLKHSKTHNHPIYFHIHLLQELLANFHIRRRHQGQVAQLL